MGRPKKQATETEAGATRKPKGFVLSVRGTDDWRAWLQRLADHDRASMPDLLDRALVAYAKGVGFKEAPPKR